MWMVSRVFLMALSIFYANIYIGMKSMYIQITVDMKKYGTNPIELQLSNQHTVKKLINIAWQTANIQVKPREGYWIRVVNKNQVFNGSLTLEECRILTGDKVEIL